MRIMVIGPSDIHSQGGIASVIHDIRIDQELNNNFDIEIYPSFIDGSFVKRHIFAITSFLRFLGKIKDFDVFHIHMAAFHSVTRKGWYIKACKRANKKVIVHIHGSRFAVFYDGLSSDKKKEISALLNSADRVIGLSDEWKQYFEETVGLTNCVSLPNGIDPSVYEVSMCDMKEYQHSFVSLGRLGERKGTYDLIPAFKSVADVYPDAKLYLAGDGELDKAKAMIKELHLENNIEVVGWLGLDGKLDILSKCATFVLPSYNEGLPMAILESMAASKVIVSSTVGAIPEVIKEENGFLVAPGDVDALSKALLTCASDLEMIERMGKNNKIKVNAEYSMRRMHEKLADIYRSVEGR